MSDFRGVAQDRDCDPCFRHASDAVPAGADFGQYFLWSLFFGGACVDPRGPLRDADGCLRLRIASYEGKIAGAAAGLPNGRGTKTPGGNIGGDAAILTPFANARPVTSALLMA